MALATRPKPNTHDRKRQAQHHTHSTGYLKTYWPYLPMLAIVAVGTLANSALYRNPLIRTNAGVMIDAPHTAALGSIARIQNLAGGSHTSTILLVTLAITAAAFTYFIVSHWYRVHRLVTKGERYVIRRPWLEISLVLIFTVGFVLTRSTIG
jgi:hypothetical protein